MARPTKLSPRVDALGAAQRDSDRISSDLLIDEYSRDCLAIREGRGCPAVDVITTIEELLKLYSQPMHLRIDNSPEFITHALRKWCTVNRSSTSYIAPGSPWENRFAESFNRRFKDKFLNIKLLESLAGAKVLAEQH
jgi:transposase InsO family protein